MSEKTIVVDGVEFTEADVRTLWQRTSEASTDDEGRPKRPGWTHGKDRDGGMRTIYRDGENVGQMLSGDAIAMVDALRPGDALPGSLAWAEDEIRRERAQPDHVIVAADEKTSGRPPSQRSQGAAPGPLAGRSSEESAVSLPNASVAEPWEWDGYCPRCQHGISLDEGSDDPETEDEALCHTCVRAELADLREKCATPSSCPVPNDDYGERVREAFAKSPNIMCTRMAVVALMREARRETIEACVAEAHAEGQEWADVRATSGEVVTALRIAQRIKALLVKP